MNTCFLLTTFAFVATAGLLLGFLKSGGCGLPTHAGPLCSYGTLPGRWLTAGPNDSWVAWQTYSRRCQLKPLLSLHLNFSTRWDMPVRQRQRGKPTAERALLGLQRNATSPDPQPVKRPEPFAQGLSHRQKLGILLFGDSVDRETVISLCRDAGREASNFRQQGDECEWRCRVCDLPSLTIANQMIYAVHPRPPYHVSKQTPTFVALQQALQHFKSRFGRGPDLLVLSSNLWDIARWVNHVPERAQGDSLPTAALDEWLRDAAAVFGHLQNVSRAENALTAYHTTAFPKRDLERGLGWHVNPNCGKRAFVSQLNAAGRHLASVHGFQVVDVEAMTSMFWAAEQYLMDNIHPQPFVLAAMANIYLNLLAASGRVAALPDS